MEKLTKKEYVKELAKYLEENNIDIYNYYYNFVKDLKNNNISDLEKKNPYINIDTLKDIISKHDEKIVNTIIANLLLNISVNAKDYNINIDSEQTKEFIQMLENESNIKNIPVDEFIVNNNKKDNDGKPKVSEIIIDKKLSKTICVNIVDFMNKIATDEDKENYFFEKDNKRIDYYTFMDFVLEKCKQKQSFHIGYEYDREINNYKELEDMYDDSCLNGIKKGIYVNKTRLYKYIKALELKKATHSKKVVEKIRY